MATHFMERGGEEEEKGRERRKREGREGMGNSNDGCKIPCSVVSSASCEVWPSAEPAEEGEGIIIYTLAYQVRIYVSEDE